MESRREVNVNRPEHSWIPFYRELAEKLADPVENWRQRQGELMKLVREMALDDGLGVPESVADCVDPYMDPFSLFACISNSSKGEKRLLTIQRIGEFFGLKSKVLHADYYVPEVYSVYMLYWTGESGYQSDVEKHWDLFEFVMNSKHRDDRMESAELIQLMDASLGVTGVRVTKLSSAFYWIDPCNFLERKTINGIVGTEVIDEEDDATAYLSGLKLARQVANRSFPEINDEVYLIDHAPESPPNVWIVRGGRDEHAVDQFLSQNRVGIGFGLGGLNLSVLSTRREIEKAYREANPDANNLRVGQNAGQIKNFIIDMNVGDYVMMPVGEHIRYGAVTSRPYHDPDVIYENSRAIVWYEDPIPRKSLSGRPARRTVSEVKDQPLEEFWSYARPSSLPDCRIPEDSWVRFHLAIAEKLEEGEWWLPEKREALDDMIEQVRWSDPEDVSDDYEHIRWTADPYSFYLSFNMRTDATRRLPGYRKVQELLDVGVDVPDVNHRARGLGTHFRFTNPPDDDDIDALWDFLRFVNEFEPVEDERTAEFVEKYDRVIEVNGFVGQWDISLSYWLYWIDPRKYLLTRRLHPQELGLAAELGLPANITGGEEYLRALKAVNEFVKAKGKSMLDVNRESTTREVLGLDPVEEPTDEQYDVGAMLKEGVFLRETEIHRMIRILRSKKNLILQGSPGVGKTFIARKLAYVLMGSKSEKPITSVQFHQSYSYEDFVGGFRPTAKGDQMVFERQDGPFLEVCKKAEADPDVEYVMLIDEINRGNLSRVFGELLMLIEADKRKPEFGVKLQHRQEDDEGFFVPKNVYIIGTMNLADRSLTGMNVAMRRRFGFVDLKPQFNERVFTDWLSDETEMPPDMQARINSRMAVLNAAIAGDASLGFNYAVGHSFFCPPEDGPAGGWEEWYKTVVDYEIRPLLREYWFDAPDKANEQADTLLRDD